MTKGRILRDNFQEIISQRVYARHQKQHIASFVFSAYSLVNSSNSHNNNNKPKRLHKLTTWLIKKKSIVESLFLCFIKPNVTTHLNNEYGRVATSDTLLL